MNNSGTRFRKAGCLAALAAVGAVARCPASDYSFFFAVSNEVSPAWPEATVTLWAAFPPQRYAFASSQTEVDTAPDAGAFSDPVLELYQQAGHAGEVTPDGDRVFDILVFQLQFAGGAFADTSNPVAVWSVTWSTDDFTPRDVPMWTQSADFWVYTGAGGHADDFYGPDFSEAQGFIRVVDHGCYPDFTGDGVVDVGDFIAYINAFDAQEPMGDCDRNDSFDLFDFLCFVNAFNAGC